MKRSCVGLWLVAMIAALIFALPASAKTLDIPDFATNPSGPGFQIVPIGPTEGLSSNIILPPTLEFGQTAIPNNYPATMSMNWNPASISNDAQAGWRLVFGTDPDLTGLVITASIHPPGGINLQTGLFEGVKSVTIALRDNAQLLVGGWGFNTDQFGALPLGPDPLAMGGNSLMNNLMQNIIINVGNGPAPGSAMVMGPAGMLVCPNFIVGGQGGLLTNVGSIEFYENGILRGVGNVIPGQVIPGLINYWDHVKITPEPASLAMLIMGGVLVLIRRR